jgi:hypothetical protein
MKMAWQASALQILRGQETGPQWGQMNKTVLKQCALCFSLVLDR